MIRVVIEDIIKVSRNTQEFDGSLYRNFLLRDINITYSMKSNFLETVWGEIEVSIVAFKDYLDIKSLQTVSIKIYNNEALLFDGVGEKSIGNNSYIYTLYTNLPYTEKLLSVTTDNKVIPIAFGNVAHYIPLLKDEASYTYYLPPSLTVNSIADDGVEGATWSIDDDGNVVLDDKPVGKISFNVTSLYLNVADILTSLTDVAIENIDDIYNDTINAVVTSQISKIDYIKKILVYTSNIAITLHGFSIYKRDFYSQTLYANNFNMKPVKGTTKFSASNTYSQLTTEYKVSNGIEEGGNKILKDETKEITILGDNSFAKKISFSTIETNSEDGVNPITTINEKFERYNSFLNKEYCEVEVINIQNITTPSLIQLETVKEIGSFILDSISFNIGNKMTTILKGFGNVDFKQI